MNPEQRDTAESIFEQVLRLPADQRSAALAAACGQDAELRRLVNYYLGLHSEMGGFLESPAFTADYDVTTSVPIRVGGYAIVRKINAGGMGIVYEARQQEPQRTVALKVIAPGLASREMLRRFKLEAAVLGQLQHPGIAQIYESGTAELVFSPRDASGVAREIRTAPQPFFAMEYVEGQPLNEYAAAQSLNIRQRLELVAGIGDAVHHAHQKGVIHRDLKPSNILVTAQGTPPPRSGDRSGAWLGGAKILDFGVARLTGSDMQPATLQTDAGLLLGTIPYMSPEQVLGDPAQIDIRCDIYSLGVILYELLTQRLPIDVRHVAVPEAARRIREDEPPRLSTTHAALRGDIETIVAKAMEKTRERRYQSAADFSADIRRYLADEPILARPASNLYKFRKFTRRNTGVVVTALLLVVALIGGAALSLRLYWRSELARQGETQQRNLAQQRAQDAEKQATRVGAINSAFKDILAAASPDKMGYDVKLLDALAGASKQVEERFQDSPDLAGEALLTVADTYRGIGLFDQSIAAAQRACDLLEKSDGRDSVAALGARGAMAESYRGKGDLDHCRSIAEDALKRAEAAHPDHRYLRGKLLTAVGASLQALRKHERAQPMLREAIHLLDQDPALAVDALAARGELGTSLMDSGDSAGAETVYREILARGKVVFHKPHPLLLATMNNLCVLLAKQHRAAESLPIADDMIHAVDALFPPNHPNRGFASLTYADILRKSKKFDDAERFALRGIGIFQKSFGNGHFYTQRAISIASGIYRDAGQTDKFNEWQLGWIAGWLASASPAEANDIAKSFKGLLDPKRSPGSAPTANALLVRLRQDADQRHPPGNAHRARYLVNLGRLAHANGENKLATAFLLDSNAALDSSDQRHDDAQSIAQTMVDAYTALHQPDEVARWSKQLDPTSRPTSRPDR